MKILVFSLLVLSASANNTAFYESFGNSYDGLPEGWSRYEFSDEKPTSYSVAKQNDGGWVLEARSNSSSSIVYKEIKVDLKKYPLLSWRWKIEKALERGNERNKDTEDSPARIYVGITKNKIGLGKVLELLDGKLRFFLERAIAYVWSSRLPKDTVISSPHTDKIKVIVLENSEEKVGEWVYEERNVYEDYKSVFGDKPRSVIGIAIMTDTDNTKDSTTAYYDDIRFFGK